jgi:hypothetical protein
MPTYYFIMKKGRFEVIKESKFDQLSKKQMSESRGGGICIACVKRKRKQGLELVFC